MSDDNFDLEPLSESESEQEESQKKKQNVYTRQDTISALNGYEALPKKEWEMLAPGQRIRVFTKRDGDPKFLFSAYTKEMKSGIIKNMVRGGFFLTDFRNGKTTYGQKLLFKDLKRVFMYLTPMEWERKKLLESMNSKIVMLIHRISLLEKTVRRKTRPTT